MDTPERNIKLLLRQVYLPKVNVGAGNLKSLFGDGDVCFFSHARQALFAALSGVGVGSGDEVLVPALICSDIIPAIKALGASVVYYSVDRKLRPASELPTSVNVKAIIAVNYFGFPQDLDVFSKYCTCTGAICIEDNAHGLLSSDSEGVLLGTRAHIGIFSLRKTLPILNGAALVVNDKKLKIDNISYSKKVKGQAMPLTWYVKSAARHLVNIGGVKMLRSFISLGRNLKKLYKFVHYKKTVIQNDIFVELQEPYANFFDDVIAVNYDNERMRRRELYIWLDGYLKGKGCEPLFEKLNEYTVPYGYPFIADENAITSIRAKLNDVGLDCFSWPGLPEDISPDTPVWYRNIWSVQFLW